MKKLAIAGASLALAAMPVVGVFATTGSNEFTDHLSVEVKGGCTLENGGDDIEGKYVDRNFSGILEAGTYKTLTPGAASTDSGTITIKCNTAGGTVTVKATAANNGNLVTETEGATPIAPGAVTQGATSGWAIKSGANSGASSDPYASFKAYTVDSGESFSTFLSGTATASGTTFNPSYQVYVSNTQKPATYTGSVTYTVEYTPGS